MSKAADRLTAISRRDTAAEAQPLPVVVDELEVKPRVSRQTVDVPYSEHLALAAWRNDTAQALGVLRVTNQEVLAALVHQLLKDETVARKVRTRISEARRLGPSESRKV
jgi:hypothetical protein